MKKTDIAWLAGIIDADGCFTVQVQTNKYSLTIRPFITITQSKKNGDLSMIKKIEKIYELLNLSYKTYKKNTNGYESYQITIRNKKSSLALCKEILPYMTCKKARAKLFLEELPQHEHTKQKISKRNPKGLITGTKTIVAWDNIYKTADFIEKLRFFNTPQGQPSKGRSNVKWTKDKIISHYKNIELKSS